MKHRMLDNFKKIMSWLVILMIFEVAFSLIMKIPFNTNRIINSLLYNLLLSSIFSMVVNIKEGKYSYILTSIILIVISILYATQIVYFGTFKVFFTFSVLGLSDQIMDKTFIGETFKIIFSNLHFIILLFLPLILYLVFKKKFKISKNKLHNYVLDIVLVIFCLGLLYVSINHDKEKDFSNYKLFNEINDVDSNIRAFGTLGSYGIDIYRNIFGFEEKINTDDNTDVEKIKEEKIYKVNKLDIEIKNGSNSTINNINNFVNNDTGTYQNDYTGMFKDYNLIYLTAESFSQIAISEELTPTLYKLTHTGFVFDNYYTPNTLSTIGGEFQSLLGLYPDSGILSTWRKGTNYFPFGLSTIFKDNNYKTYAYHNNSGYFQDRNKYLKSIGFNNFKACYIGLNKKACTGWPESDIEMMRYTMDDYMNEDRFMAYYMTVSGHFDYSYNGNSMGKKYKNLVKNLPLSEAAQVYQATQIELDKALELLISTLEEKGKLDNTVFVLLADHYPYKLSISDINSLAKYNGLYGSNRDSVVEVNHNSLILWNSKLETVNVEKVCMSSDVIPTVYNLFGLDYDSRLMTGKDILSTEPGLAIMSNRSYVTDIGTYFTSSKKFVAKKYIDSEGNEKEKQSSLIIEETVQNEDGTESVVSRNETNSEYATRMSKLVSNRLSIAKSIIKNNYYNTLKTTFTNLKNKKIEESKKLEEQNNIESN